MTYLLQDTKNIEKERLLLKILPQRYLTALEDDYTPEHVLPAFVDCFHTAYNQSDDKLKGKVANWFVKLLKEESDRVVFSYGTAFMRFTFLNYLTVDEVSLVKEHFLSRLDNNTTSDLLVAIEGIGAYLDENSINKFVDPLVRLACSNSTLSAAAITFLKGEHSSTPLELDSAFIKRFDAWINMYNDKKLEVKANIVEEIKSTYELEPF